jgi:hypothetical protein
MFIAKQFQQGGGLLVKLSMATHNQINETDKKEAPKEKQGRVQQSVDSTHSSYSPMAFHG